MISFPVRLHMHMLWGFSKLNKEEVRSRVQFIHPHLKAVALVDIEVDI